ncbi:MAG: DUF1501 domain-containing protein [Candidatus Thiodiazotropha sp. (ex Ctena orbiculata)]|uniref:DUF1501 domain-containing protein n=1 Tax=Candidatus Thiodiazotropha taylori TaxID=2792791 RepID=A0A944MGR8_9GAMM|nr:DUF1501 domain-containing protein [Candidatus Thiodiazotropha taylori]PUB88476.1 MAG: hypothetical protein DBP00_05590 [gamma proteobacterium symbiont of Ctena orbiculata]MBT2991152.1 DUF1501 domain-containing protein [Candidatus Thiodiazotropha taylori]MBT2998912.1 DUF1501 domain-containing protein [Candidatus Thiodiazotropha taylori]MBT3002858.1 DUF1501 domain-containing protein [Candidatus Thiodiazotropha taylori]
MNRREFLKRSMLMGGLIPISPPGQLFFTRSCWAAAPSFSDYKALVCVFLYGGNDTFNMLIPYGSSPGRSYRDYASVRGSLAVADRDLGLSSVTRDNTNLNRGNLGPGGANPYHVNHNHSSAYTRGLYPLTGKGIELAVNGIMPELAQLIYDDRVSIVANTGTLVEPVSRADIAAGSAELPHFLFAHNHQQRELQTGRANDLGQTGWAGRIADAWNDINGGNPVGLNLSYLKSDLMMVGQSSSPLVLKTDDPPIINHLRTGVSSVRDDRRGLFLALAGAQGSTGRLDFNAANTPTTSDYFKLLYNRLLQKSVSIFDFLESSWRTTQIDFAASDSYGRELFSIPTHQQLGFAKNINGVLINQLASVAKMIHMGASGTLGPGYNRQIFLVQLGGFDTHARQAEDHPLLLRELSLALWKFQSAMEELGYAQQVTTFTMSDFGRTLTNNGDGTDHAWASNQLVMGGVGDRSAGRLDGGKLFGTLPDLRLGGADDHGDKGRYIPTTAQDQVNAAITRWFGVDDSLMRSLFPNLANFQSGADFDSSYIDLFV